MVFIITFFSGLERSDYISIFSSILVILLFGLERFLSFKSKQKELERTWYYNVLVEPSLKRMSDFFKESNEMFISSVSILKESSQLNHDKFLNLKTKETGNFQTFKREFDIEFITPINQIYPEVGCKLLDVILKLEDHFTSNLSKEDFSEDDQIKFTKQIFLLKSEWLSILYIPIQKKI